MLESAAVITVTRAAVCQVIQILGAVIVVSVVRQAADLNPAVARPPAASLLVIDIRGEI